jgi:hypothetical protein
MTVWISLGISAGAFVVSVAAVVLAYRQLAQAKIANALPVVLGLLDDFSDTRAERHFIIHDLSSFEASKRSLGLARRRAREGAPRPALSGSPGSARRSEARERKGDRRLHRGRDHQSLAI